MRFVALIVGQILLPRCVASMLMDPYLLFLLQRKSGIRMARVDSPTTSVSQFSLSFSPPPPLPPLPFFSNETTRKLSFEENSVEEILLPFSYLRSFLVFTRYKLARLVQLYIQEQKILSIVLFLSTEKIRRRTRTRKKKTCL